MIRALSWLIVLTLTASPFADSSKSNPKDSASSNSQNGNYLYECGKVTSANPPSLILNGKSAQEGEWPWQVELFQTEEGKKKYMCGGILVTDRHIITTADCVAKKEHNLTVHFGKHNSETLVKGVNIDLVKDITIHPEYNAQTFARDIGIITFKEPVQFTEWVRPVCLWPEDQTDLNNVIGKKGSVVSRGFDDLRAMNEELNISEMTVVDQLTCIRSFSEFYAKFTSDYTYCAGFGDGKDLLMLGKSECSATSGSGMVFRLQDRWYLRGVLALSVAMDSNHRCDPSHYIIFTDVAKVLPWIQQTISNK